jgi:hypothetical protein
MHYGTGVAFTPADSSITKDKTNFVSTSSSSGLQIKGDGTTDGTLQLNCSQNSHGVKIKSPAHSAGQSYTLTLPATAPASNKIMQTDGSGNLSFVDTPSGNFVKLGTVTTNNSNVSALTIDNCFSSTYDMYKIVGYHSATSGGAHNYFRWRTGGSSGSSYTTSDYQWINEGSHIKAEPLYENYYNWNYSSNHGRVGSALDVDSNSSYVTFDLLVSDPNTNVMSRAQVTGTSCLRMTADDKWTTHHVGITNASNVNATGFEMTVSTGSINYGRVTVYGLAQ